MRVLTRKSLNQTNPFWWISGRPGAALPDAVPLVDELSKEYEGKVKVGKLNTDDNAGWPRATGFRRSPLLFFKDGKVVDQLVGVHPKPEIKKRLDALLVG